TTKAATHKDYDDEEDDDIPDEHPPVAGLARRRLGRPHARAAFGGVERVEAFAYQLLGERARSGVVEGGAGVEARPPGGERLRGAACARDLEGIERRELDVGLERGVGIVGFVE